MAQQVQRWFPHHMRDALDTIKTHLKNIDLILEVRDARIPLSSRNEQLEALTRHKPRIIIFNKMDLAAPYTDRQLARYCRAEGLNYRCTALGGAQREGVAQLVRDCHVSIVASRRHVDLAAMMVLGVPNSGKSTLINALKELAQEQGFIKPTEHKRLGGKAKVAPRPGETRHVSSFMVAERPRLFVLDTPGIAAPQIKSDIQGFRLALTGAVPDTALGERRLAAFLAASLATQRAGVRAALETLSSEADAAQHKLAELRDAYVSDRAERELNKERRLRSAAGASSSLPGESDGAALRRIQRGIMERSRAASGSSLPFARPRELSLARERLSFVEFVHELGRSQRDRLARLESDTMATVDWVAEGPLKEFAKKERSADHEGKEQALLSRLVRAYRSGQLGQYSLDDVRQGDAARREGAEDAPLDPSLFQVKDELAAAAGGAGHGGWGAPGMEEEAEEDARGPR